MVDGVILGNSSGLGKDSVTIRAHNLSGGDVSVNVNVISSDKQESVSITKKIQTVSPKIGIYQIHPLEGVMYNKAIGKTYVQTEEEVSIKAVPYFFSLDDIENDLLHYRWNIDRTPTNLDAERKDVLVLRKDEDSKSGTVKVGVEIENFGKLLQFIKRTFSLTI